MNPHSVPAKISVNANPQGLQQWGPNLGVIIQRPSDETELREPEFVPAIIDTGSPVCCISASLAQKLKLPSDEPRNIIRFQGTKIIKSESEPTVRAKIAFPNGVERDEVFSIFDSIDEYDVLIGRDLLRKTRARLFIDFDSGDWYIEFLVDEDEVEK